MNTSAIRVYGMHIHRGLCIGTLYYSAEFMQNYVMCLLAMNRTLRNDCFGFSGLGISASSWANDALKYPELPFLDPFCLIMPLLKPNEKKSPGKWANNSTIGIHPWSSINTSVSTPRSSC